MVLLFASCQKDAGLTYKDKNGIYFIYNDTVYNKITAFDKVTYSFGMLDDSKHKDTAKIVLRAMGKAANKDRFYRVSINTDSTTAVEGIHYEIIQPLQKFKANKFIDTLKIVVLRDNLSSSHVKQESKRIALKIEESDDFNVGIAKGAQMKLVINNYLNEPKWWKNYLGSGLYFYHPEKWKVLMKFHDNFKNPAGESPMAYDLITKYFSSLRAYLIENTTRDKETNERVLIDRLEK